VKNLFLAFTVAVLGLSSTLSYANDLDVSDVEVSAATVEMDADGETAKLDGVIFCSVAMVNRRNQVLRRYNGRRNLRSFRCEGPMRQCRQDLRWSRRPAARCVELR